MKITIVMVMMKRMFIIDVASGDDEDCHYTASGDDGVGGDTLWALPVLRPVTIN